MKKFQNRNVWLMSLLFAFIISCSLFTTKSFANSFGSMLSGIEEGAKSSGTNLGGSNVSGGNSGDSVPLRPSQNNAPKPAPSTNIANIAAPNSSIDADTLFKLIEASAPGQAVLVNFYASWCGPCVQELPHLIQIRKDFPEDKLLMIGVNLDQSASAMKAFNSKVGINYPTYHDKNNNILSEFDVNSIPFNIVFDPDLDIVFGGSGYMDHSQFTQIVRDAIR